MAGDGKCSISICGQNACRSYKWILFIAAFGTMVMTLLVIVNPNLLSSTGIDDGGVVTNFLTSSGAYVAGGAAIGSVLCLVGENKINNKKLEKSGKKNSKWKWDYIMLLGLLCILGSALLVKFFVTPSIDSNMGLIQNLWSSTSNLQLPFILLCVGSLPLLTGVSRFVVRSITGSKTNKSDDNQHIVGEGLFAQQKTEPDVDPQKDITTTSNNVIGAAVENQKAQFNPESDVDPLAGKSVIAPEPSKTSSSRPRSVSARSHEREIATTESNQTSYTLPIPAEKQKQYVKDTLTLQNMHGENLLDEHEMKQAQQILDQEMNKVTREAADVEIKIPAENQKQHAKDTLRLQRMNGEKHVDNDEMNRVQKILDLQMANRSNENMRLRRRLLKLLA